MGLVNRNPISRRICPVVFLLDASGSMTGQPIDAVNDAMSSVLTELAAMNLENEDVEFRVAALSFRTAPDGSPQLTWVTGTSGLQVPGVFPWTPLEANGASPMGAALLELERCLHMDGPFLSDARGFVRPVLLLFSDGMSTDDITPGLEALLDNNWYLTGARVAVGFGNCDDRLLEAFTRDPAAVRHADSVQELRELISFLALTSSAVAGRCRRRSFEPTESDDMTLEVLEALDRAPQPRPAAEDAW